MARDAQLGSSRKPETTEKMDYAETRTVQTTTVPPLHTEKKKYINSLGANLARDVTDLT